MKKDSTFYNKLNVLASARTQSDTIENHLLELTNGTLSSQLIPTIVEPIVASSKDWLIKKTAEGLRVVGPNTSYLLKDDWLKNPSSIVFHPSSPNLVLICIPELEHLLEFDLSTGQKTFDWCAWENGFSNCTDIDSGQEIWLTKDKEQAQCWDDVGKKYIYINTPSSQSVPERSRSLNIQSAEYNASNQNLIVANFSNRNAIFLISKKSKNWDEIIKHNHSPNKTFQLESSIFFLENSTLYLLNEEKSTPLFEEIQSAYSFQGVIIGFDVSNDILILGIQNEELIYDRISCELSLLNLIPTSNNSTLLSEIQNKVLS